MALVHSGSRRHSIRRERDDEYVISWCVEHKYSGSRILHHRWFSRDTNRKGAERFAEKWGVAMPPEPTP
jgi:hypothetical protein